MGGVSHGHRLRSFSPSNFRAREAVGIISLGVLHSLVIDAPSGVLKTSISKAFSTIMLPLAALIDLISSSASLCLDLALIPIG